MGKGKFYLFYIIILLFTKTICAESNFFFSNLSVQNELVNNNVKCVFRTSDGLLLIGTTKGISIYNGTTIFEPIVKADSFFQSSTVHCFHELNKNEILIGGENYGIVKYLPASNEIVPFAFNTFKGVDFKNTYDIKNDINGNIWVASSKSGFFKLNINDSTVNGPFIGGDGWPQKVDFFDKYAWCSTWRGGNYLMDTLSLKIKKIELWGDKRDNLVLSFPFLAKNNRIYAISWGLGLVEIENSEITLPKSKAKIIQLKNNADNSKYATALQPINDSTFFVSTTSGLYCIRLDRDSIKSIDIITKDKTKKGSLTSDVHTSMFLDNENLLWIGNKETGVHKLNLSKSYAHKQIPSLTKGASTYVLSINKYNDDEVFVGLRASGLFVLNLKTNEIKSYFDYPKWRILGCDMKNRTGNINVISNGTIAEKEYLMIGTNMNGFYLLEKNGSTPKTVFFDFVTSQFSDPSSIITDCNGSIWYGNHWGLSYMRLKDSALNSEIDTSSFDVSFSGMFKTAFAQGISKIICDKIGNIYIFLETSGALFFPRKQYVNVDEIVNSAIIIPELGNISVTDAAIDSSGNLCLATYNNGLIIFDPLSKKIKKTLINEQYKTIRSVSVDKLGAIWFTSNYGIYKLGSSFSNPFLMFDNENNIDVSNISQNSLITTDDSRIIVGTSEGVDILNIGLAFKSIPKPTMQLNTVYAVNRKDKMAETQIKGTFDIDKNVDVYTIPYLYYMVKVSVSNLSMISISKNTISYRLVGYNNSYTTIPAGTPIEFQNLPSGKYFFEAYGTNSTGDKSKTLRFEIDIKPAFWNTTLFRLIVVFAFLFLVFLFIKANNKRILIANKRLNKLVAEKTDELQAQNEKLKELVQLRNHFIAVLSHDLRSPLSSIYMLSDILNQQFDDFDRDKFKKYLRTFDDGIKSTYELLENLVLWGKNQLDTENSYIISEIVLCDLIKKVISLFTHNNKNIEIILNCKETIMLESDSDILEMCIRNVLNNALKFSYENSSIIIEAKEVDGVVEISIEDTGIGIPDEIISKIIGKSDDLSVSRSGTKGEKGIGLGLQNVMFFLSKMEAKLSISSRQNKGTKVTIYISKD